jgi:hypothetical protein
MRACGASLSPHCGRPVGAGVFPVIPMAVLSSNPRRAQARSLRLRQALVLEQLPLADAIASAAARRLFPLVERDDLIQVGREALLLSAPSCRAGEPAAPYLGHWVELLKESPRVLLQVLSCSVSAGWSAEQLVEPLLRGSAAEG